jgi:hypothetical protein
LGRQYFSRGIVESQLRNIDAYGRIIKSHTMLGGIK